MTMMQTNIAIWRKTQQSQTSPEAFVRRSPGNPTTCTPLQRPRRYFIIYLFLCTYLFINLFTSCSTRHQSEVTVERQSSSRDRRSQRHNARQQVTPVVTAAPSPSGTQLTLSIGAISLLHPCHVSPSSLYHVCNYL